MLTEELKKKLDEFLKEDIGKGDITSSLIDKRNCKAEIRAKENCVLSGLEEASYLFKSHAVKVKYFAEDGKKIQKNKKILELFGENIKILEVERTALNVLSRMSAISTNTIKCVKMAGNAKIMATRKTSPGFNLFDKKAVEAGGGLQHRKNLSEMVLIKDNHLKFGKIKELMKKAKHKKQKVEVEVENFKQLKEAIAAKPDIVMLDNFSAKKAKQAIKEIRKKPRCKIELSGGINYSNLKKYSSLKPDFISMGCLTQDVKGINFSLEVIK